MRSRTLVGPPDDLNSPPTPPQSQEGISHKQFLVSMRLVGPCRSPLSFVLYIFGRSCLQTGFSAAMRRLMAELRQHVGRENRPDFLFCPPMRFAFTNALPATPAATSWRSHPSGPCRGEVGGGKTQTPAPGRPLRARCPAGVRTKRLPCSEYLNILYIGHGLSGPPHQQKRGSIQPIGARQGGVNQVWNFCEVCMHHQMPASQLIGQPVDLRVPAGSSPRPPAGSAQPALLGEVVAGVDQVRVHRRCCRRDQPAGSGQGRSLPKAAAGCAAARYSSTTAQGSCGEGHELGRTPRRGARTPAGEWSVAGKLLKHIATKPLQPRRPSGASRLRFANQAVASRTSWLSAGEAWRPAEGAPGFGGLARWSKRALTQAGSQPAYIQGFPAARGMICWAGGQQGARR